MELYFALPQVDGALLGDDQVLDWWKRHQSMFPNNLSRMIRQHLALPVSSAGVERLFSSIGETHGDKRKRLKEETMQSLMFINQNA